MKFVVYLVTYVGDKLPPYYIGSTSLEKAMSGKYFGSVQSRKYKRIFADELKNNPSAFTLDILEEHDDRKTALCRELEIQKERDVVKSDEYFNMALACKNGCFGTRQVGSPSACKGRMWINDGTKSKMIHKSDIIPTGWSKGRCSRDIDSMKANQPSKQNSRWITSTHTNEHKRWPKDLDIPDGWIAGRGSFMNEMVAHRTLRSYKWYHDPVTNTDVRIYEGDDSLGLVKGRNPKFKESISKKKQSQKDM